VSTSWTFGASFIRLSIFTAMIVEQFIAGTPFSLVVSSPLSLGLVHGQAEPRC
jgi:hypothetical protein